MSLVNREKMRAVVCDNYGPAGVLKIEKVDIPNLDSNEILVKVKSTTVTQADSRVRGFRVPLFFWLPARLMLGLRKPKFRILGVEFSGIIDKVGTGVLNFRKGDKVYGASLQKFGAYGEYIALNEDDFVSKKPENITYEEAASIPIGGRTAYYYLREIAKVTSKQNVLIYGASGSVGTFAVQIAKFFGAKVTGVCSDKNINLVRSLGADIVLDYTKTGYTDEFSKYDVIFLTNDNCPFDICQKALNDNGIYMNIGRPVPSIKMILTSLFSKRKIIVGKNVPENKELLIILRQLINDGNISPVIDKVYDIEEIVKAHAYVDSERKRGNVAVRFNN